MASGFLPACSIGLSLQRKSWEPFASSNLGQRVSEPTQPLSHEPIERLEESTRIDQSKRRRVPFWLSFASLECRLRSRGLLRFGQLLTDQLYFFVDQSTILCKPRENFLLFRNVYVYVNLRFICYRLAIIPVCWKFRF